jgi:hypothetical protein
MTLPIVLFLAIGALFGLLSYPQRHHFSEGSTAADADRGLLGRLGWAALCTPLWPLMLVSGAFGLVNRRLARSKR